MEKKRKILLLLSANGAEENKFLKDIFFLVYQLPKF